jgi:WD40 repeat protein
MSFSNKPQAKSSKNPTKTNITNTFNKIEPYAEKKNRKISKKPYKMLEAPNLQDDFYLNLLDWSENNQIAVALDSSLYIWSGCSSDVTRLYETNQINDYICSVSFCQDNKIAFGNSNGQIKVYDIAKKKQVNSF